MREQAGHRTCVIDFDIGLRNMDLHLGCERRVIFDFVNVIQVRCACYAAIVVVVVILVLVLVFDSFARMDDTLLSR